MVKNKGKLPGGQRNTKSGIYRFHPERGEGAYKIGKHGFGKTDQPIAVDGAVVFQSLINTDLDLGGEPSYLE
ncbi:MAG: hypothetical protein LBC31_05030 [Treponema sp.]|jgi:hypothetical protein|nr:hypothetical protein [Treponema sp.]